MTALGRTGVPALTNLSDQSTLPVHVIDIRRDKRGWNVYTTGKISPVKFYLGGKNKLLEKNSLEHIILTSSLQWFVVVWDNFFFSSSLQYQQGGEKIKRLSREHLLKKRMFSFGHCLNYLSPPPTAPNSENFYNKWLISEIPHLPLVGEGSHKGKVCKNIGWGGEDMNIKPNLKSSSEFIICIC